MNQKLKKKIIFTALALFLGLSVAFIAAEILIRIFAPQNLSGTWRIHLKSGLAVNKSSGNSLHQQNDREVIYRFTQNHTRESKPIAESQKILVLGDSFTFGWLLDYEKSYVGLLQSKLNQVYPEKKYQLINAAAGGWGAASYTRFLEEVGPKIKPSKVLIFMSTDDIGRAIKSGLYEFDEEEQKLNSVNVDFSTLKELIRSFPGYQIMLENSHLFQLLRRIFSSGIKTNSNPHTANNGPRSRELKKPTEYSRSYSKLLFERANNWCLKNNTELIVVTNGWGRNIEEEIKKGDATHLEPTIAFQSIAKDFFKEKNIPFYDATFKVNSARIGIEKEFVIPLDCHPNEKGAKLIFDVLWDSFLKENFK